jgi:hypothetical protein
VKIVFLWVIYHFSVDSPTESQITELKSTNEELMAFNEFRLGSIHEDAFYNFWKDTLEAPHQRGS